MEHSYRFFCNRSCEYFPCHQTEAPDDFNCLFCFCPLYFFEECGGNHRSTEQGVKDCTACLIPHVPKGYDHIVGKLKERFARMRGESGSQEVG